MTPGPVNGEGGRWHPFSGCSRPSFTYCLNSTPSSPRCFAYPRLLCPLVLGRFETAVNHVVELGASWLLLAPVRAVCMLGGALQTGFQLAIIVSGNLSFLNYLTILPFIWCFDDR